MVPMVVDNDLSCYFDLMNKYFFVYLNLSISALRFEITWFKLITSLALLKTFTLG